MEESKLEGAKRAIELKTSGPFHTSKLKEASEEFSKYLEKTIIQENKIRIAKNIDGTFYQKEDDVKEILANHMISPVHFKDCINTMLKEGIDTFIEIGPGKVLSGFVKKTNPDVTVLSINDLNTLQNVIKMIKL